MELFSFKKNEDQRALAERYSLQRFSPCAFTQFNRNDTTVAPTIMIERPVVMYSQSQNNIQASELINQDIISANQQLFQSQLNLSNILMSLQAPLSFCTVSHPHQIQIASSEAQGVVLHSGTFNGTSPATLADDQVDHQHRHLSSRQESDSWTSLTTTSLGNHNQPEQQPRDFSLRSTYVSSGVPSTIGAATENRQDRSSPIVNGSQSIPHTIRNSAKTSYFGTCLFCYENESNTVLIPCGHISLCTQCATRCNDCPICRSLIRSTVRVFLV